MSDPPRTRTRSDVPRPDPAFWGEDRPRRARITVPRRGAMDALRDRLHAWRDDARLGILLLAVVAVVAGVLWYRIGAGGGDETPPRAGSARVTATTGAPAGATRTTGPDRATGDGVIVHVAGAVTHPGVVELATGSRVIDAVEAAGGGLPDADLDRLNLAAKLADGQRVLVQRVGDPLVATDAAPGSAAVPGDGTAAPGLLNLNTATQAQLEELPGIGPSLATAILDERTRRGSFRSVNELRDVRGIGEKRFADLHDKVTV